MNLKVYQNDGTQPVKLDKLMIIKITEIAINRLSYRVRMCLLCNGLFCVLVLVE